MLPIPKHQLWQHVNDNQEASEFKHSPVSPPIGIPGVLLREEGRLPDHRSSILNVSIDSMQRLNTIRGANEEIKCYKATGSYDITVQMFDYDDFGAIRNVLKSSGVDVKDRSPLILKYTGIGLVSAPVNGIVHNSGVETPPEE